MNLTGIKNNFGLSPINRLMFSLRTVEEFCSGDHKKRGLNTAAIAERSFGFILIGTMLALNACVNTREGGDEMCPAIAAFANAATDEHSVRLKTDWGGEYYKSEDPKEEIFFAKNCMHDAFEPGKELCKYLLENTSTEFPASNYRRALECIGIKSKGLSPADDDRLPPSVTAHKLAGLRRGVVVKLGFTGGNKTDPPTLTILVRQKR